MLSPYALLHEIITIAYETAVLCNMPLHPVSLRCCMALVTAATWLLPAPHYV